MRVLIVDDSAVLRRALRETLEGAFAGAEIGEAGTVAEGLSLLEGQAWEVVLLDLSLPDGGGMAAVAAFRCLRPRVSLVVMSMHPASQYAAAVQAAGAAYVAKGSDPEILVAAVRAAAGRTRPDDDGPQPTRHALAREPEGRRLARVLHDELGQLLTALKINLRVAASGDDLEEMRGRTSEAVTVVDEAIRSVRRLVARLSPPLLDELGLAAALRAFVAGLLANEAHDLAIDLSVAEIESVPLDAELESAAFLIIEEALTNVVRHAGARTAAVKVRRQGDDLQIDVRDDGRGFDVAAKLRERGRWGLLGIRERTRALGGRCEIRSAPGGTELRIVLPEPPTEARPPLPGQP